MKQPSNTTATGPVQKAAVVTKRKLRSKAQPVATCQMLDMIEEVNEDSQEYPDFNFSETESEAADLCEILHENSDLSVDEPLIDLTVDQQHDLQRNMNQRNTSLSSLMIAQIQE